MQRQIRIISFLIILGIIITTISPVYANGVNISAPSAILIDSETGRVLFEKNADTQRAIASTTKIMTYLLVMDAVEDGKIKLNDRVKVSKNATQAGGSSYYLRANDVLTVKELLESMMIISANDSAVALAEYIDGSVKRFCNRMNAKAKSIGLQNAYFVNPNGMPLKNKDQNKMTAREMALLTKYVIDKYGEHLFKIVGSKQFKGNYKSVTRNNTNRLLRTTSYIDGLKTGYTDLAGYCLVSTAKLEGTSSCRLIAVVFGGKSSDARFNDSKKLINYGLKNFHKRTIVEKGEILGYSQIKSEEYIPIELVAKESVAIVVPKNKSISIDKNYLLKNHNTYKESLNGNSLKSTIRLTDGTEMELELIANRKISILVDDNPIIFDKAYPYIESGSIIVPLRQVLEALGGTVEWDNETKTIIGKIHNTTFKLNVDSNLVAVNDKYVELDMPLRVIQGCTMVPVRFIAESLEIDIQWEDNAKAVKIYGSNELLD